MRQFTLYTPDRKKAFSLNGKRAFATEPKGLGNKFDIAMKETATGRQLSNIKPTFEPITLNLCFNADGSSGYANYKELMNFFSLCGRGAFIFEVKDGVTTRQCDVVLDTAEKSEIQEEGFIETFIFQRLNFWYEEVTESFSLKGVDATAYSFPLSFPFMFHGYSFTDSFEIKNDFYEQSPITVKISGAIENDIVVYLENLETAERVAEVALSTGNTEGTIITIDASNKKVLVDNGVTVENGYSLVDKTKQSFLFLPQGRYKIGANITQDDKGAIQVSVKRYLLD
jgi:hypothetical protein